MTAPVSAGTRVRHRIRVTGVVQGVGFRPFVHRLAVAFDLEGLVGNDADGVFIEVEGEAESVSLFERELVESAPPLARVHAVNAGPLPLRGDHGFRIVESPPGGAPRTFVSPDVAVCDECLRELLDPSDRRYRYPFLNCTNCGPRFTITIRLPYDRPNTTMAGFSMCLECEREYGDPRDRRFHAQPIACPACGPRLWLEGPAGTVPGSDEAIAGAQAVIAGGGVVAVKGLGGYHLACDALSDVAVAELRRRKRRPDRPLAVMVADEAGAALMADDLTPEEAACLAGPARPIVLLPRRPDAALSPLVAPGNPYVGVMLPYTPLHHLLFRPSPGPAGGAAAPVPRCLVMTSGNLSDEPICYDDADARRRLGPMVDAWLVHDRPIHVPCDDSVVRVVDEAELPIRRSRGYAPLPVRLPFPVEPTLAVGGELKNTFCLATGRDAWMSQHIGDMGSVETIAAFECSGGQFGDIYGVRPTVHAADAHPGYMTRRWAEDREEEVRLVQHHHAHVAAAMVEHGVPSGERVIGFAFDGTGYGDDGAIWGGEVLVADYERYDRVAHLAYVPLPGGDATIKKPYRSALSHLWGAGIPWDRDLLPVEAAGDTELEALRRQLERGVFCVPTSSMGRLFDAVSSLLGIRHVVSYEAQAAIELEAVARHGTVGGYAYRFAVTGDAIDARPVLGAVVAEVRAGVPAASVALAFHVAVADLVAATASRVRRQTGLGVVALSGGVFQNVLLTELVVDRLDARGFEVLTHRVVPPNDGGLALGQLAVAAHGRRPDEVA